MRNVIMLTLILVLCCGCATVNLYSGENKVGPFTISHVLQLRPPTVIRACADLEYTGPIPGMDEGETPADPADGPVEAPRGYRNVYRTYCD